MKKIYLLSLLSIFSLNLLCQVNWTKHSENPVMVPGTSGEWDETLDYIGSIILHDDTYMMWYSGYTASNIESVGLATSPDGVTWTRDANNPVFKKGPEDSWDQGYVSCGDVTMVDDTFHMWYNGHGGSWENPGIGHAFSTDGINWERDTNNPVLTVEPEGTWEYLWIWIDEVVFDGNIFHMWYEGGSLPGEEVAIGHATSPDGTVWTRDPSNPVLQPKASEDWDYPCIAFPSVVFDGRNFYMWYCGGTNVGHNYDIGYATSTDGSDWTKYAGNPVMEKGPKDWDAGSVLSPNVIDSAGIKYKMWYGGKSKSAGWDVKFSYAESNSPAWKQMKSMDIARGSMGSCVVDSLIYVFGGLDVSYNTYLDSSDVYNTETNEWIDLAAMPINLLGVNTEVVKNKIYLAGGWHSTGDDNFTTTNSTTEYDPKGNTWQIKTYSPEPMGGNASCVLNDTIYNLGGVVLGTESKKRSWIYAPETDSWGSLPVMKYDRPVGSSANILDNKIYVIGGTYISSRNHPTGKSEMYDPKLKTWKELADMPVPVVKHISVVHNQKILVFGGDSSQDMGTQPWGVSVGTNIIQEYDPATDSWRRMEGMPFKRSNMAGEKVGDYVYLIGGYLNSRDLDEPLSEVWRFNLDSLKAIVVPVTGVSLDTHSLEIEDGITKTLKATVSPEGASDTSVIWSSADPAVATVADGVVTGVAKGDTYIYATTADGGFKDSCLVNIITEINNVEATGFKLYPNPVSDLITLEFNKQGIHIIKLTTLNGQLLYSDKIESPTLQIDLSSFQKGLYFITVRSRDFVRTEKILKL